MSGYPWFASTTSGGLLPDNASRRVVLRSWKDFEVRTILTFGYFAWNSLLSWVTWAFCPPRTSWSQTFRVTWPAFAGSVAMLLAGRSDDDPPGPPEPGGAQAATT